MTDNNTKQFKVWMNGNGRSAVVRVQATSAKEACELAQAKYGTPYPYAYVNAAEIKVNW